LIQGFKELDKILVIKYYEAIFKYLIFPHSSGKEVGFNEPITVSQKRRYENEQEIIDYCAGHVALHGFYDSGDGRGEEALYIGGGILRHGAGIILGGS
jgi:hypothetical protein